ncbi:MAG: lysophospholipid acyltransferase family protein [Deltaproteobacteria bacterium]
MRTPKELIESLRAQGRSQLDALRHDGVMWRRFAYKGTAESPEWFRRYSPPYWGTGVYLALPRTRRAVVHNQALLLGLSPDSLAAQVAAQRVFAEFAHCLTDALEMSGKPGRPFEREYVDSRHFFEAIAKKRGVILVTAHTGSWEVGGRLLKLHRDIRTTMVMAEEVNQGSRGFVDELRKKSGVDVLYASGNDPSTAITLLSRLRNNEVIAIQIDRPPASAKVITTRLAGAPWRVPEGPFRLAQASGAPVIPVFLRRSGYRRYTFTLAEPIEIARRATPDELQAAAQRATDALERFVRTYPDQWFHFSPIGLPEA